MRKEIEVENEKDTCNVNFDWCFVWMFYGTTSRLGSLLADG